MGFTSTPITIEKGGTPPTLDSATPTPTPSPLLGGPPPPLSAAASSSAASALAAAAAERARRRAMAGNTLLPPGSTPTQTGIAVTQPRMLVGVPAPPQPRTLLGGK